MKKVISAYKEAKQGMEPLGVDGRTSRIARRLGHIAHQRQQERDIDARQHMAKSFENIKHDAHGVNVAAIDIIQNGTKLRDKDTAPIPVLEREDFTGKEVLAWKVHLKDATDTSDRYKFATPVQGFGDVRFNGWDVDAVQMHVQTDKNLEADSVASLPTSAVTIYSGLSRMNLHIGANGELVDYVLYQQGRDSTSKDRPSQQAVDTFMDSLMTVTQNAVALQENPPNYTA